MLEIIILVGNSVRNWNNVMRPTVLFNEGQRRKYFEIKSPSRSVHFYLFYLLL